jgi:poly(3-hydroxybutyrate) depolymerase
VAHTIVTMGVKDPNCAAKLGGQPKCGAWSTPRDYYVYLPVGYDESQPYPLVFEGPGCGGNGTQIYPLTDPYPAGSSNAGDTVIRIGLTPAPNSLGHGTNENQGCFDDKEGDDSLDWVFYETLYDKLNEELCFDRHRVFGSGNSSGSWMANELGCKYAGDPVRPIRGVVTNTGGLPDQTAYRPTCTNAGMAGMWVYEAGESGQAGPYAERRAIARAMPLNGCTATTLDIAKFEAFPVNYAPSDALCQRMLDCDPLYPIVTCMLPGNGHGSHDAVVNPGFSTFLKLFSQVPLAPP